LDLIQEKKEEYKEGVKDVISEFDVLFVKYLDEVEAHDILKSKHSRL